MRAEPVNQSDGPFAEGCEPAFLISIEESYALSLLSHSYRRAVQRSDNGHPAVHSERMTNDVARARTAKPQHGRGDLLGLTGATDRNVFRDVFIRLLVTLDDIAGDLRVNQAGIHRIHPDTFSDVFERGRPRQADHAMLRSYIGSDSGLPVNAPTDVLLTMAPLPWRSICRSSCFMQLHTPRRLIPITRSQSSRVLSAMGAMWAITARIVKYCVDSAELGNSAVHHRRNLRVVTHVAVHSNFLMTGGNQLLRGRLHRLFFIVCQHDTRSRFGERLCGSQSHARCGAGDEGHLTAEI